MSTYYKECFVEQVYHYDALDEKVWMKLVEGTNVSLDFNKKDAKEHVKVKFKVPINGTEKKGILGILSVEDSKFFLPFLEAGRDDVFTAKICLKSGVDSEHKRIKVIVFIAPKKG